VHPKKENQVRHMAWANDGVWVSIRLDTTLRLYHARTRLFLQHLDIEPFITKMLGTSNLGLSLVRISSLMVASKRLWIGTGNGVILSVPFTDSAKKSNTAAALPGSIVRVGGKTEDTVVAATSAAASGDNYGTPFCKIEDAQFSFHGHRDAIKFFLNVPSETIQKSAAVSKETKNSTLYERADSVLVVSGGHGYIDFRIGDTATAAAANGRAQLGGGESLVNKNDDSRLIVWQINE
jgi:hypothetical protein